MDILTNEPHPPCQNQYESVINIIKVNTKGRIVQKNIVNRVCDFVMVWEAEIYSCTAGNDALPVMPRYIL